MALSLSITDIHNLLLYPDTGLMAKNTTSHKNHQLSQWMVSLLTILRLILLDCFVFLKVTINPKGFHFSRLVSILKFLREFRNPSWEKYGHFRPEYMILLQIMNYFIGK